MAVLSFFNQSAPTKSVDQNSANLINLYMVAAPDQDKYQTALYPTPGLTTFATVNSPIRAIYNEHEVLFVVGGNTLYSITSGGIATSLGTLNTSSGFAKIRGIHNQIMVIDGTNGYNWNIGTSTFTQISDANFTNTATDLEAQDELFMVLEPNSQTWQICATSDGLTWTFNGIPIFASATGNENNLVAIKSLQRQMWLLGSVATEVWYNAGTAGFPFARNTSVYIEWGCSARDSVAYANNTIFFLGRSRTGGTVVISMNGYTPQVVSTAAINYQISTYTTVSDAVAITYQQEGHEFYAVTFPTAGVTWVYDMTIGQWHQRQSLISGNQTRWLANCFAFCYNKQLVGDYQSGNVYQLDMTNFTENGAAITRTLVSHPFYAAGNWIYADLLQIDFDETSPSSGNTLSLFVSRDGGRTFGSAKTNSLAGAGTMVSGQRVYWPRLGNAKTFVFKVTTSMAAKFIILGAWANIRAIGLTP